MQIRRLGRTGLKVSEVCLGTMTFGHQSDEHASFDIMDKAAEQGVNFLDCADVYPVPPSPETAGKLSRQPKTTPIHSVLLLISVPPHSAFKCAPKFFWFKLV